VSAGRKFLVKKKVTSAEYCDNSQQKYIIYITILPIEKAKIPAGAVSLGDAALAGTLLYRLVITEVYRSQ
jgi:hypothetical protein